VGLTITKEEIAKLPIETFSGKIEVIDDIKKVPDAVNYLLSKQVLGFDTETKPSFKRGQVHKVALMQLSSEDTCFLFRLNRIGYPDLLDEIICNPDIKKIGLSLKDDFAAIRRHSQKPLPHHLLVNLRMHVQLLLRIPTDENDAVNYPSWASK
jgi:hypothetical protein